METPNKTKTKEDYKLEERLKKGSFLIPLRKIADKKTA